MIHLVPSKGCHYTKEIELLDRRSQDLRRLGEDSRTICWLRGTSYCWLWSAAISIGILGVRIPPPHRRWHETGETTSYLGKAFNNFQSSRYTKSGIILLSVVGNTSKSGTIALEVIYTHHEATLSLVNTYNPIWAYRRGTHNVISLLVT